MKKSYEEALAETKISDDKLRKIITEAFEQKFSFFSKRDYLRWINEKTTSERLKSLIVEWMSEEEINEHPTFAGYYQHFYNRIKARDIAYMPETLEHELNHFLNANVNQFPRYIDEGITEFLAVSSSEANGTKIANPSYKQNVRFVELLYNIFGDELIKCYLSGVTSEFENKLSSYLGGQLHTFYDLIEKIHSIEYSHDRIKNPKKYNEDMTRLNENEIPKYRDFIVNMVKESIKEEMLDFKYYSNSKIDFNSLLNTINDRIKLIARIVPFNIDEKIVREMYTSALSNSYLTKYYSEKDISEIINNNIYFGNGNIHVQNTNISAQLDGKTNTNDNMYYAAEMRLNSHNYYSNGGFDISSFLLDFYTLSNSEKKERTSNEKMQLLHSLLFKTLKSEVNMDIINNILSSYGELFSNMANIRTSNKKTTSESIFFDVAKYKNGSKKYVEKRDNEFYFISYNSDKRNFSRKGIGFWQPSYNRNFPREVNYIERENGRSHEYRILFDQYFENALFDGKKLTPIELLNDVVSDELKNNIDYNKYLIKYSNGNVNNVISGQLYIPDAHTRGMYIFDFETLFKDLSCIKFLKADVVSSTIYKIIDEALGRTFQLKTIPESIKNILYKNAIISHASKEEIEECLLNLIDLEKEYIEKQPNTGAYYFKNEEEYSKFTSTIQKNKNQTEKREKVRQFSEESRKYAEENYRLFIDESYDKRLSSEELKFGIKGLEFSTKLDYESPMARKINFELLIPALKQVYSNLSAEEKSIFNGYGNQIDYIIDKLLGEVSSSFNQDINSKKDDLISKLYYIVTSDGKYDVNELDQLVNEIVTSYDKTFESAKKALMARQTRDPMQRQVYKKLLEIYNDEKITDIEKEANINLLVSMLNQPQQDSQLKYIDELINKHRKNYLVNNKSR